MKILCNGKINKEAVSEFFDGLQPSVEMSIETNDGMLLIDKCPELGEEFDKLVDDWADSATEDLYLRLSDFARKVD